MEFSFSDPPSFVLYEHCKTCWQALLLAGGKNLIETGGKPRNVGGGGSKIKFHFECKHTNANSNGRTGGRKF